MQVKIVKPENIDPGQTTAYVIQVTDGMNQSDTDTIAGKRTIFPHVPKKPVCNYFKNKYNDCSTDEHCKRIFGLGYPYCVRSEGPQSKKICCNYQK